MTHPDPLTIAREALTKARDRFREYEREHQRKADDLAASSATKIDRARKAHRNREMADQMDAALAQLAAAGDGVVTLTCAECRADNRRALPYDMVIVDWCHSCGALFGGEGKRLFRLRPDPATQPDQGAGDGSYPAGRPGGDSLPTLTQASTHSGEGRE